MSSVWTPECAGSHPQITVNLSERGELIGFLRRHGIEATKELGQHFLCSQPVVKLILKKSEGFAGICEVGPGPGILTHGLSRLGSPMIALEVDPRMVAPLTESSPSCEVIVVDALKANLPEILDRLPRPRVLVSNMPYYITGPLLDVFAKSRMHFDKAVLMMQREVGHKIIARPGKRERGSLSVNLQTQFQMVKVADVPPTAFFPPPKVDSVVIEFTPRFEVFSEEFYRIVKAGNSQPRKTLANNLANTFRVERSIVLEALESGGLPPAARGNELTEDDWLRLEKAWAASFPISS